MLRSMSSAVAGLRAHQNKLDVVGNNIANVNTFGYKAQTYTFQDTMYQTSNSSTGGSSKAGGTNAAQYGYGALMGTIGMDMTASTPSYTGGFNACINGEGFFITCATKEYEASKTAVEGGTFKTSGIDWDYTRVGQFLIDSRGYLTDGNGNFVYGFQPKLVEENVAITLPDGTSGGAKDVYKPADGLTDKDRFELDNLVPLRVPSLIATLKDNNGNTTGVTAKPTYDYTDDAEASLSTNVSINKLGEITATVTDDLGNKVAGVTLGKVAIVIFQNPNGLTKAGGNYFKANNSDNTGLAEASTAGGDIAELMPGYIEASNVDLSQQFADMITSHRGYQANTKMITLSDEILSELVGMVR